MPSASPVVPLRTAEFLVVDTETNGKAGELCEATEVGAVLVGGGELHDTWETLLAVRRPLGRGIQRFTGISQDMLEDAPEPGDVLPELAELLRGRVLVAHNASFDRRVLKQAFERAGLDWPDPPVLCTVALARRLAPLAGQRKLKPLAESLGIDVELTHRALADAETCARVFCALFPRLCAHATTLEEAQGLVRPARPRRAKAGRTDGGRRLGGVRRRAPDLSALPDEPGVYLFRNDAGQVLYVGKSVTLRTRARAHFAPSSDDGDWTAQVELCDHVETPSELGALLLEHELITQHRPPGNVKHKSAAPDRWVYLRARLDIPFPVLEVSAEPASGHAVNVGPLRGRHAALELLEQLNSLFGLRHCGRGLKVRPWASAYGQMGRCLSPCLGDLDPNLYRRRLDEALGLFSAPGGAQRLIDHVTAQMHEAAREQRFERAAWLRRRRERLRVLLDQLGGTLENQGARPQLVVAQHPTDDARADLVWLVGGRVVDRAPLGDVADAVVRTERALRGDRGGRVTDTTPVEAAAARIVATWVDANDPPVLDLRPAPSEVGLRQFLHGFGGQARTG